LRKASTGSIHREYKDGPAGGAKIPFDICEYKPAKIVESVPQGAQLVLLGISFRRARLRDSRASAEPIVHGPVLQGEYTGQYKASIKAAQGPVGPVQGQYKASTMPVQGQRVSRQDGGGARAPPDAGTL